MVDERATPEEEPTGEGERKRRVERVLPDLVKKLVETAVERGVERLAETPESLRNLVGELKLPKEVLHHVYGQIDDTKTGLYRVVAKELRDFLEHTKFADELVAALTKLSFEVRMEVRFVPNTAAAGAEGAERADRGDRATEEAPEEHLQGRSGLPRPRISTQVSIKDQGTSSKEGRRSPR
jgi:hypothetical protein